MHETVSIDSVRSFREYELPLEFNHLSEKCHLSRNVNQSTGVHHAYEVGSFSASRGFCSTKG